MLFLKQLTSETSHEIATLYRDNEKNRKVFIMEYHSAMKKNSIESVLEQWMKLEPIIQSEVSQKEKHQYSNINAYICGI